MIDRSKADQMPNLPRNFFEGKVEDVAPTLIGCYLFTTVDDVRAGGMIIETEAYDQNDPFAHCYSDAECPLPKDSAPMFFEPGSVYIYYSGQLPCLNLVCGPNGFGSAVLIRALLPTHNADAMLTRRTAWYRSTNRPIPKSLTDERYRDRNLCNGPSVLCESLGINDFHYKKSKTGLFFDEPPFELRSAVERPAIISGIRIGLDKQLERIRKDQPSRAILPLVNIAGGLRLRWGADEFRAYCRVTSFDQKWLQQKTTRWQPDER